ncbi:hypothetical protein AB6806_27635 [Bosea sp. RCC_152_1]|uniref:hypothetical protein n=1 Tax=Bosea sp. RCC_152_1 TaxID=3239228 RepID=UPI0035268FAE
MSAKLRVRPQLISILVHQPLSSELCSVGEGPRLLSAHFRRGSLDEAFYRGGRADCPSAARVV